MKKVVYGIFFSFLLYLLANYIFLRNTSESRQAVEEGLSRAEMAAAHAINEQARADGVFASASLKIENESSSLVTVKIIKAIDDSEYVVFFINEGGFKETPLVPGDYYLKLKYRKDNEVYYQRGDEFNIPENSKTTINLKEVMFGNYGTSSIGANQF